MIAARAIAARANRPLTVYDSGDQIFRALCAGASGYLLKNTPPARLLDTLREVADGCPGCDFVWSF